MNTSVIVGYYAVPGFGPDTVETPVTGKPAEQYRRLDDLMAKRHPSVSRGAIKRTGSVVELRDGSDGWVNTFPGATTGQIFTDDNSGEAESNRVVGTCFFSGAPYKVVLVLLRAQGFIRVQLQPVLRTGGDATIRFSNQIHTNRLATELPGIIAEVVGADARDMKLKFREAAPKPPIV